MWRAYVVCGYWVMAAKCTSRRACGTCIWQNPGMRTATALLLPILILACSSPPELTDQQKAAVRAEVRMRISRLLKEMDLSVSQYREIKPILAASRDRILGAALKAKQSGRSLRTWRALKSELKTIRADTRETLHPVLNEEQLTMFDEAIDDVVEIIKNARQ